MISRRKGVRDVRHRPGSPAETRDSTRYWSPHWLMVRSGSGRRALANASRMPARIVSGLGGCSDAARWHRPAPPVRARSPFSASRGPSSASDSAARTVARRSGRPSMPSRRARTRIGDRLPHRIGLDQPPLLGLELQPAQLRPEHHLDGPRLPEAGAAGLGQGIGRGPCPRARTQPVPGSAGRSSTSSTGLSSRTVSVARTSILPPRMTRTPALASLRDVLPGLPAVPRVFRLGHHRRLGFGRHLPVETISDLTPGASSGLFVVESEH